MEKEPRNVPQTDDQPEKRDYIYVRYEDDDDEMSIYDIIDLCRKGLLILKKHLVLLLVFLVLGAALGFVKAKGSQVDAYTSSSLLFIDIDYGVDSNAGVSSNASQLSMLANSFAQIISSESVVTSVAAECSVDDTDALRSSITAEIPDGTQTIKVSVTCDDPQDAQKICEVVTTVGIDSLNGATDYATISVVSPASQAIKAPVGGVVKTVTMYALIFLVIAVLIVAIKQLGIAYKAYKAAESAQQ